MINNGLRWARLCLVWMITAQLMLSFTLSADAVRRRSSNKSRVSARRDSNSSRTSTKRKTPKLKGDNVSLRTGPGEKSRRITLTDVGTRVKIIDRHKGWLQVRLPGGKEGWLRGDFVAHADSASRSRSRSGSRSSASRRVSSSRTKRAVAQRVTARKTVSAKKSVASTKKPTAQAAKPTPPKAVAAVPDRRGKRLLRAEPAEPLETSEKPGVTPEQPEKTAEKPATETPTEVAEKSVEPTESAGEVTEMPAASEKVAVTKLPSPPRDIVRTAYAYRGTPYRFGGMSTRGFDCSGFTSYIFRQKGITLPRTAAEQFRSGKKVSPGEMQEGDLVFFHTTRAGISHVGMYVGNGNFIHASSRGAVRVDTLNSGYYKERFRGARRYSK